MTRMAQHRVTKGSEQVPRLTCKLCQERKVKCDKLNPCTNCRKASVPCETVERKRLPRGRHAQKETSSKDDLKSRIQKLEALVCELSPNRTNPSPQPAQDIAPKRSPQNTAQEPYLAGTFWKDLVEQVHGLRDAIDPASDEEEFNQTDYSSPPQQTPSNSSIVGLGHASGYSSALRTTLSRRLGGRLAVLCTTFRQRVDPIVKILHFPSLTGLLLADGRYLGYPKDHVAPEALKYAVYYIASCSVDEETCPDLFHSTKIDLRNEFRGACEGALQDADLLTTNDMTVLQAFVLYLIATRSYDQSRAVWTLVPVAIRIAQALCLHDDSIRESESIFNQQMRKRLWYTICHMDLQASGDRGSDPLVPPELAQVTNLKNYRDDQLHPGLTSAPPENQGFNSDLSLALVLWNAQELARKHHLPFTDSELSKGNPWATRMETVEAFEKRASSIMEGCDTENNDIGRHAFYAARSFVVGMKLLALRPMKPGKLGPPLRIPGDTLLYELAVSLIEKDLIKRSDLRRKPFKWFGLVPWFPLSIAITESFACEDVSLLRRFWPIVERSYEDIGNRIADHRNGMLWRPIEKLMKRTKQRVEEVLEADAGSGETLQSLSMDVSDSAPDYGSVDASTVSSPQFTNGWTVPVNMTSQVVDTDDMIIDPAWDMWEIFAGDLSFGELPDANWPYENFFDDLSYNDVH